MEMISLPPEVLDAIKKNPAARRKAARESHWWFFRIYFGEYIKYPTAAMHDAMFKLADDASWPLLVLVAFRGSAKSTIWTLSYVLWSIMGRPQKKFVLIIAKTIEQAQQFLKNIRTECERNNLLTSDLGPFDRDDQWTKTGLILTQYGAKIMAISVGQAVRSLRHNHDRPDLIICDDVEDMASVQSLEMRDKSYNWVIGEIFGAGDLTTQTIVIGNYLHEDSLTQRLRIEMRDKGRPGIYREYPLLTEEGRCLWPEKFPTKEDIEHFKSQFNEETWYREFLLKTLSTLERVIQEEWIQRYDIVPSVNQSNFVSAAIGMDLAISDKESADCTAIVAGLTFEENDENVTYILPNPINKRMNFPEQRDTAIQMSENVGRSNKPADIIVEEVGYQKALIDELQYQGYPARGSKVQQQDKRVRLALVSPLIRSGRVKFPREGAEDLIKQLVNFGRMRHDDLADAFAILMKEQRESTKITITMIRPDNYWQYRKRRMFG